MVTPQRITAPEPIEAPRQTRVGMTCQSASVCKLPPGAVAAGNLIVDEADVMADEALVLDRHAFADESVRTDLAAGADRQRSFWISTKVPILVSSPTVQPYRLTSCGCAMRTPAAKQTFSAIGMLTVLSSEYENIVGWLSHCEMRQSD